MLVKEDTELTAWHVAAKACNVELLERLREWDKKQQTAEQLNYRMFLMKGIRERTE